MRIVLTCILSFIFFGCADTSKEVDWDKENYLGHLKLDSTVVLLTEIVHDLDIPWGIEAGPDNWLYYTEQKGTVSRVHSQTREQQLLLTLDEVYFRKSTGLYSLVLHPDFKKQPYIFLHYVRSTKDTDLVDQISSIIVRYTLQERQLINPKVILGNIPGNTYHNGSRMVIHDHKLWMGTGDIGAIKTTQDPTTLNGKVIRLNLDGSIPDDNPFSNAVWSVGHRNIQGIAFGKNQLYVAEHGPLTDDEINFIQKGANYGWPNIHGYADLENEKKYAATTETQEPLKAWTPTIATAGLGYYDHDNIPEWKNSLLLSTLKGQSFRVFPLNAKGDKIRSEKLFFQKHFGRLRDITIDQEGNIYLATSNMDWHQGHQPWLYDSLPKNIGDRIIKLEAVDIEMQATLSALENKIVFQEESDQITLGTERYGIPTSKEELSAGQKGYVQHCATCHRPDGNGIVGSIPPLTNSEWVSGNTSRLIEVTLAGLNIPIMVNGVSYNAEMPAYQNLADDEIAAILNYIRAEFSDVGGNIKPADIKHQRKALNK